MSPAYKQVSLTEYNTWTKQCPSENHTSRCRNKPSYQYEKATLSDRGDLQLHAQDLLSRWYELGEEQRYAKATRITMLSVCRKHNTETDVKRVCDNLMDDLQLRITCLGPHQTLGGNVDKSRTASLQSVASSLSSVTFGRQSPSSSTASSNSRTPIDTSDRAKAPLLVTPESLSTSPCTQNAPTHARKSTMHSFLGVHGSPSIKTAQPAQPTEWIYGDPQHIANHELAEENRSLRAEIKHVREENQRLRSLARESKQTAKAEAKKAKASRLNADKWNKFYVKAKKLFNGLDRDFEKLEDEEGDRRDRLYLKARKLVKKLRRKFEDLEAEEEDEDENDDEDEDDDDEDDVGK